MREATLLSPSLPQPLHLAPQRLQVCFAQSVCCCTVVRQVQVVEPIVNRAPRVGRNDPCPCGSGRKFKRCCLDKRREMPLEYKVLAGLGAVILLVSIILLFDSLRG